MQNRTDLEVEYQRTGENLRTRSIQGCMLYDVLQKAKIFS